MGDSPPQLDYLPVDLVRLDLSRGALDEEAVTVWRFQSGDHRDKLMIPKRRPYVDVPVDMYPTVVTLVENPGVSAYVLIFDLASSPIKVNFEPPVETDGVCTMVSQPDQCDCKFMSSDLEFQCDGRQKKKLSG